MTLQPDDFTTTAIQKNVLAFDGQLLHLFILFLFMYLFTYSYYYHFYHSLQDCILCFQCYLPFKCDGRGVKLSTFIIMTMPTMAQ